MPGVWSRLARPAALQGQVGSVHDERPDLLSPMRKAPHLLSDLFGQVAIAKHVAQLELSAH
jgi:hypothetical protein